MSTKTIHSFTLRELAVGLDKANPPPDGTVHRWVKLLKLGKRLKNGRRVYSAEDIAILRCYAWLRRGVVGIPIGDSLRAVRIARKKLTASTKSKEKTLNFLSSTTVKKISMMHGENWLAN